MGKNAYEDLDDIERQLGAIRDCHEALRVVEKNLHRPMPFRDRPTTEKVVFQAIKCLTVYIREHDLYSKAWE